MVARIYLKPRLRLVYLSLQVNQFSISKCVVPQFPLNRNEAVVCSDVDRVDDGRVVLLVRRQTIY